MEKILQHAITENQKQKCLNRCTIGTLWENLFLEPSFVAKRKYVRRYYVDFCVTALHKGITCAVNISISKIALLSTFSIFHAYQT